MVDRMRFDAFAEEVLSKHPQVRYVATCRETCVYSTQRSGLENASSSESDRYEELFVNPIVLKAVSQRGNLDCGGVRFFMIRYANFCQLIIPTVWGHASFALEGGAEYDSLASKLSDLLRTL